MNRPPQRPGGAADEPLDVRVGPLVVTIHADEQFLVCGPDATMVAASAQGYFVSDTRHLSSYRLTLSGTPPVLVSSSAVASFSARFEFVNAAADTPTGRLEQGLVHLRLDRTIGAGVHEDYDVVNYGPQRVEADLEIRLEGDYADLFEVKSHHVVRRGRLQSGWDADTGTLTTSYADGDFGRGLTIQVDREDAPPEFANGTVSFRIRLEPRQHWHTCLLWSPTAGGHHPAAVEPERCHALLGHDAQVDGERRGWARRVARMETGDPGVNSALRRAVDDLAAMRMHRHDVADGHGDADEAWVPAAGIPWFVSLFGRDSLMVALQTLVLSPRFALAALESLAPLQADAYDDAHDAQPGKILHEIRHGELAHLHLVPQTPYYGTADATILYVWAAAQVWRWTGDRAALGRIRSHVERALAWIDTDGDLDGDGLQEYRTRAGDWGYYNQGWKDSGQAIVHADGSLAKLPIALCELQGYVVAAKRGWADVLEEAFEEGGAARALRDQADRLAEALEARFWWPGEGTYYLGLDGDKRPIASVASNPGHLLWAGAVAEDRARAVVGRLTAEDMWSGWGVRTLSSTHRSYNPFSYQRGSVWPHDNAIAAAGFLRYGCEEEAWRVARGLFDAAERFQHRRLPEVFAGLERDPGAFPAQYLGANVPQAWASGAVVHLIASLAGLDPRADHARLLVSPSLPAWLGRVELRGVRVGAASVDLALSGHGGSVVSGDEALAVDITGPSEALAASAGSS